MTRTPVIRRALPTSGPEKWGRLPTTQTRRTQGRDGVGRGGRGHPGSRTGLALASGGAEGKFISGDSAFPAVKWGSPL